MVKVICDICKNEITKGVNEYRLEALIYDRDKEQYNNAYKSENVCEYCINAINNFIMMNLKK